MPKRESLFAHNVLMTVLGLRVYPCCLSRIIQYIIGAILVILVYFL